MVLELGSMQHKIDVSLGKPIVLDKSLSYSINNMNNMKYFLTILGLFRLVRIMFSNCIANSLYASHNMAYFIESLTIFNVYIYSIKFTVNCIDI